MDIYEIRKSNLLTLIGKSRKGACAIRWEMAPAHMSQILSDKTEKNLGDDVARRIESIENLPHGWMDRLHGEADALPTPEAPEVTKQAAAAKVLEMLQKHGKGLTNAAQEKIAKAVADSLSDAAPASNVIHADFPRQTTVRNGSVLIPQYDVRGSMGNGQLPAEYREFVQNLVVDKVELDALDLKYTAVTNLKIITGWGQSMLGTISDKAPLIIDVGVTNFVEEGVYVFSWLGHLFIKRVQLLDAEHYQLVSDNKAFEPQAARMEDVYFQARVLGVWNFTKL